MNSMDALDCKELPSAGPDRYFVWLCKMNYFAPVQMQLSDAELHELAKLVEKKLKRRLHHENN